MQKKIEPKFLYLAGNLNIAPFARGGPLHSPSAVIGTIYNVSFVSSFLRSSERSIPSSSAAVFLCSSFLTELRNHEG